MSSEPTSEIECTVCHIVKTRGRYWVNRILKSGKPWICNSCETTSRNLARALPIGTVRCKEGDYPEEKTEEGWIRQNRLVVERHLGIKLPKGTVVHHINEIITDNHIDNLEVLTNAEHTILHHTGVPLKESTKEKIRLKKLGQSLPQGHPWVGGRQWRGKKQSPEHVARRVAARKKTLELKRTNT